MASTTAKMIVAAGLAVWATAAAGLAGLVLLVSHCDCGPPSRSTRRGARVDASAPRVTGGGPPITEASAERQTEILIAGGECSRGELGASLAVAGDLLLVGAPRRDYAMERGARPAACLYRREATTWTLVERVVGEDGAGAEGYGRAVAVDDRGAVVGSPGHENGDGPSYEYRASAAGLRARHAFEMPNAKDEVYAEYGVGVSLGSRHVFVGAPLHMDDACGMCGATFMFRRDSPALPATMIHGTWPHAALGSSVAASDSLLALGTAEGAVVLRVSGDDARPLCRLQVEGPFEGYGGSVAVDGDIVVVGGAGLTVYQVRDDECVALGNFAAAGASVAITGKWIAAGQPRFDGAAKDTGRVGVFEVANGTVRHRFWLSPRRPIPEAQFGRAVAISTDTVFGGAPAARDGQAFVAAARLP